jgi:recombination protein RecT
MAKKETKSLVQVIDTQAHKIREILPEGQNSEKDAARVIRLARLAIVRNPKLMDCTPISVVESIMVASQLGLEINSPIGGAHLVPFGKKCQMIPDYRGLIRLALKNGDCGKLVAREVYEGDMFHVIQGTTEMIEHVPLLGDEPRGDDNITGFYAVATLANGLTVHEYAPRGDVDKIRARSKAGSSGPWKTDYAAMGKKTMIKRVLKWLDLSPDLAMAIEYDNRGETGYSTSTSDRDTEDTVEEDMKEQASQAQKELSENLDEARRKELIGEPHD